MNDSDLLRSQNRDVGAFEKVQLTLVAPVFNESETVSFFH